MKIKVQTCWCGSYFVFRALICGGLRIKSESGKWNRKSATEMLDLLETELSVDRRNIRFVHV